MATIKVCDRCGEKAITLKVGRSVSLFGYLFSVATYDLCPDCRDELKRFLHGAKVVE